MLETKLPVAIVWGTNLRYFWKNSYTQIICYGDRSLRPFGHDMFPPSSSSSPNPRIDPGRSMAQPTLVVELPKQREAETTKSLATSWCKVHLVNSMFYGGYNWYNKLVFMGLSKTNKQNYGARYRWHQILKVNQLRCCYPIFTASSWIIFAETSEVDQFR